ncbi:universal stress protein [Thioalkalivibrio sulfidiphilus]|uniref:UspA domain protein n=1 Tax=Thioalkalivibrio sulfidiphilus (strain HL-EbGR7) TaxID=396588 RepID=B8GN96_THISH|nr:universal stress protein [Thioalkalivibrio sulfidiphilus]ACL71957.1 UspA domain protein [Thioalkalivibrio sulfidiphilus HL-EbGr7]
MTDSQSPLGQLQDVLLATDASENSQAAEAAALELASRVGARLHILRVVVTTPEQAAEMPRWVAEAGDEAKAYIDGLKERAVAQGLSADTYVRTSSDPYGEIAATAQKLGCGLIMLGRHERSEFARLLKGQTINRLMEKARCSVMMLPAGTTLPTARILVATDGSEFGDAAVAGAVDLASRLQLPLTAVSVYAPGSADDVHAQAYDAVARAQEAAGSIPFDGRTLEGKPAEAILEVAAETGADLIVLGSLGRSGLGRLFMGSVAQKVVSGSPCAVLVTIRT